MLKAVDNTVTKCWSNLISSEPFYDGGKLEVCPDEKTVACLFEDDIRFVDILSNTVCGFSPSSDDGENFSCFCLHPNGHEIVVSTRKFTLCHWNIETKKCLRKFRAHQMPILALTYDPSGTLVASGSADKTVRVWDIEKGFCTHLFKDHTDIVQNVYFHLVGTDLRLFSSGNDCSIRLYHLNEPSRTVVTFQNHVSCPTQIIFSHCGNIMISSGRDKVLNFYHVPTHTHLKTWPCMEELECITVLSSEHSALILKEYKRTDGNLVKNESTAKLVLLSGGSKGVLRMTEINWDLESGLIIKPLADNCLSSKSYVSDNELTITSVHYLKSRSEIMVATKNNSLAVYSIQSIADKLHRLSSNVNVEPIKMLIGNFGDILDMVILPTSHSVTGSFDVAVVSNSNQVRILNQEFTCGVLIGHSDIVLSVDVSPDGKWLMTSSKDRSCRFWSVDSKECVGIGESHTDAIGSVALCNELSSYGTKSAFAISGGGDKIIKRWNIPVDIFLTAQAPVNVVAQVSIRAHDKDINCVAVSPNDLIVASASQDKTIRLWNSGNLTPIATLNGHKRGVWKVIFSPIDKVLASCSGDRTVKLWSMSDYSVLRTLEGHTASVLSICFVNHGSQLVSGSADGLLRLWTIRTGDCENSFDKHFDKVWSLATFECEVASESHEAGSKELYFLSGGSDSRLLVWKDETKLLEDTRLAAAEEGLLLEQQLFNLLKHKNFGKAISIALGLGHSSKVLSILISILETLSDSESIPDFNNFEFDWATRLDTIVSRLDMTDIEKLVSYLKDWNMNSRYCYISQILINSLLRVIKIDSLLSIQSVREIVPALLSYSERHFQRVDKLNQSTFMLKYVTSLISLLPDDKMVCAEIDIHNHNLAGVSDVSIFETDADKIDSEKSAVSIRKRKVSC